MGRFRCHPSPRGRLVVEPEYPHLDRALSFASSLCHQRQIDAKQFGILSDLIHAAFREGTGTAMRCDDCGTEDPGAPSYKPACLIERDMLRARVATLEADYENAPGYDERTLRARIAVLESALREIARREECQGWECLECGVRDFRHGNCDGCLARASLDSNPSGA